MSKMTTEINIDYYEELKAKADKWVEKETPYKIKNKTHIREYIGGTPVDFIIGTCLCGTVSPSYFDYCSHCGQSLTFAETLE